MTPEDELREIKETKHALDSSPEPGDQIEPLYEEPRSQRRRGNRAVLSVGLLVLTMIAILIVFSCNVIVLSGRT